MGPFADKVKRANFKGEPNILETLRKISLNNICRFCAKRINSDLLSISSKFNTEGLQVIIYSLFIVLRLVNF